VAKQLFWAQQNLVGTNKFGDTTFECPMATGLA